MRRAGPGLAVLLLAACSNVGGVPGAAISVSSGAPFVRTAATTPRPTFKPTPSPTPPRDDAAPVPPATPAPVPSQPIFGDGVGGPTPSPAGTLVPTLALTAGDQTPDTWLVGPPLRRARAGLVAAVVEGVIVAAEGTAQPSVEMLGPIVDDGAAWRLSDRHDPHLGTGSTLPSGIALMAGAATTGALYTLGGADGATTAAVSRYGSAGYVDQVASLPVPVRAAAAGQFGDVTVVVGGLSQDGPTAAVRRLRLNAGTGEAGADAPLAVAGAASAVLDGKLWVIGGYAADRFGRLSPVTDVMVYDPAANTWRKNADAQADPPPALPEARHSAAAAVVGGQLYVVGGAGTGDALLGTVLKLDRSGQPPVWKAVASLPTPRALLGVAVQGGRLWAIGGRGVDRQPTTVVEVYQP